MSMAYIRKTYNVPAKRGARVEYTGRGVVEPGTIIGARDTRLRIRLDGHRNNGIFHPTWELRYLPATQAEREKGQP